MGAKQTCPAGSRNTLQEAYMQLCNTMYSRCQLFSTEPETQNECGSSFIVSKGLLLIIAQSLILVEATADC